MGVQVLQRRIPKGLYIFHDTFCEKTPNRVRNYHTTPKSTKTKYMRGGWIEISKKFKEIIEFGGTRPGMPRSRVPSPVPALSRPDLQIERW